MARTKKPPSGADGQTQPNFGEFSEFLGAKHLAKMAAVCGPAATFFIASVGGFAYEVTHGGDVKWCAGFGAFTIIAFVYLVIRKQPSKE